MLILHSVRLVSNVCLINNDLCVFCKDSFANTPFNIVYFDWHTIASLHRFIIQINCSTRQRHGSRCLDSNSLRLSSGTARKNNNFLTRWTKPTQNDCGRLPRIGAAWHRRHHLTTRRTHRNRS